MHGYMTTAMAAVFFALWLVWAIQAQGVGGFLKHLFAPKGETTGVLKVLMVVIFFMVGWLEVISILFRPVFVELSALREHLCRRKHFGSHGAHGAGMAGVAAADRILFYGDTRGRCAGARVYVAHGGIHDANRAA